MINDLHLRSLAKTSVLLLAMTAVGCGSFGKKKGGGGGGGGDPSEDPKTETEETTTTTTTEGQETEETTVTGDTLESLDSAKTKVRNFTQFYSTYTSLLEIPENDQDLMNFFLPIKTNLPTLTDATGFLGSHQLALVKFGSKVCERSWDLNTSPEDRARIFGVDTESSQLATVFNAENSTFLARTLISRLWGNEFDSISNDDSYVQIVVKLINDSVNAMIEFNPSSTDATKIKYGVVGACSAVLTSAGVSFYGQ